MGWWRLGDELISGNLEGMVNSHNGPLQLGVLMGHYQVSIQGRRTVGHFKGKYYTFPM